LRVKPIITDILFELALNHGDTVGVGDLLSAQHFFNPPCADIEGGFVSVEVFKEEDALLISSFPRDLSLLSADIGFYESI
jgi:hypothetical protein